MPLAPEGSDSTLKATDTRCLECGSEDNDPTADECENCGSDVLEHLHVSETPLGYDNDDHHHIAAGYGRPERWEYPAADPRPSRS